MFMQRYCVYASPSEQAQLEQVARRGTTPQKVARRAQMVLMLSHHESASAVARTLHVSRMTVRLRESGCPVRRRRAAAPPLVTLTDEWGTAVNTPGLDVCKT